MSTVPGSPMPSRRGELTLRTARGAHVLDIDIALTSREQQMGLMFTRSIPDNAGMLFLYAGSQEVTMWMKDTYVSLDMVFIKADGEVHRIATHTVPLSKAAIPSHGNVLAVLELAAGSADRLGLQPGDRVVHPAFASSE